MSHSDEYIQQIVKTKDRIRALREKKHYYAVNREQGLEDKHMDDEIKLLERMLEGLDRKYQRSLKRG